MAKALLSRSGPTENAQFHLRWKLISTLWPDSGWKVGNPRAWLSHDLRQRKAIGSESLFEVKNGWKVTVAVAGQRIVGFLATKPAISLLDQLFVAPDMKGKGTGKALLASAKAEMPKGFTLHTAVENSAACAFYERSGLTRIQTETHPTFGNTVEV